MTFYGPRQLAASKRTVRRNTIQIANDIPEAQYGFRPTPESRSAAELLIHIAWLASADQFLHDQVRVTDLADVDFGALVARSEVEEGHQRTKAQIIDLLTTEGERHVRWIEQQSDAFLLEPVHRPDGTSTNRFEMLLGSMEHEMQHRAQLTVLERLVGIVPHFTRNLPAPRKA